MYHREKVINGELHFQTVPDGPWHKYTNEQLTKRILKAEEKFEEIINLVDELREHSMKFAEKLNKIT